MGHMDFWVWAGASGSGEVDGVVGEGGSEFDDVGAVGADGLVEEVSGDVELPGPKGDVGGDFGVDLGFAGGDFVAVLGFRVFDGDCGGDDVGH